MNFPKILLTILLIFCFAFPVSASETEMDWFFKSKNDNSQPTILGGNNIAEKYDVLYMGKDGDKTIYLTFDAGYSNENLEKILDILKSRNVKGAFFILPGIIKNSPETVKRMVSEGHLVCNHSTSHGNMAKITDISKFKEELSTVESQYKELTGMEMEKYFRPPQGKFSENTLAFCKELGYTPVFWSFAYADWDDNNQMSPQKATENALNRAHDGMVMLLHPTGRTNAEILDGLITQLKSRGYSFGTLHELKEKLKCP